MPRKDAEPPMKTPPTEITSLNLTPRQRLLWLENQLAPRLPVNVEILILTVDGDLSIEALRSAVARLAANHDALNARLAETAGGASIEFGASIEAPFIAAEIEPGALREWIVNHLARPFAAGEPLSRIAAVREGSTWRLILCQSHLITDGHSIVTLFKEWSRQYADIINGRDPARESATLRFRDAMVRPTRQGGQDAELKEWRRILGEPPPPPQYYGEPTLPTAGVRRRLFRDLTVDLGAAIVERPGALSPSMFFAAIAAATLRRTAGTDEIRLSTPLLGRAPDEFGIAGVFIDAPPLALAIDDRSSLRMIGEQIRAFAQSARSIRHAAVPATLSGADVIVNYYPPQPFEFAGMPAEIDVTTALELLPATAAANAAPGLPGLTIWAFGDRDGRPRRIAFDFDVGRWPKPADRTRFADHFHALLVAAAVSPDRPIGDIDILTADDRAAVDAFRDPTANPLPPHDDILDAIRAQARAAPDKIAVHFGAMQATYAELMSAADRVAAGLRARGVGEGDLVAICMDRGIDLLEGMLGVLSAGAAYVPLDPKHPASRLSMILEDASPKVLLTDDPDGDIAITAGDRAMTLADVHANGVDGAGAIECPIAPDLAYVIFTSGSTGRPKGVAVRRSGLSAFLAAMRIRPGFAADDELLAVTTVSFDIAALELFLPLYCGGSLRIAEHIQTMDAEALQMLLANGPTTFQATPATFKLLQAVGWRNRRVKVLCGGEAMPETLAAYLRDAAGAVWNMYGPTETTIWSSTDDVSAHVGEVSIGKPIPGTGFSIRTQTLGLAPLGAPGELCIHGAGLARGYLNDPARTERSFPDDPYSEYYRLYMTGDLARLAPDGRFRYLGRNDFQVKVRGFRVELGEIESQLRACPGVADAIVTPFVDASGQTALAGYVVGDTEDVRPVAARLAETLPPYMRPAALIRLDAFPLTPNGKIDRKALPAPDSLQAATSRSIDDVGALKSDVQRMIADVWRNLLKVERIGPDSDFFELGGHSLLAFRMVTEIESASGVRINLGSVFENSTLAKLAALVGAGSGGAATTVIPLHGRPVGAPLFCLCGIELYSQLGEALNGDADVFGVFVEEETVFLEQALKGEIAEISIATLAERYVDAIMRKQPDGPCRLAGVSFGGVVALEAARELARRGRSVDVVFLLDTIRRDSYERRSLATAVDLAAGALRGEGVALARRALRKFAKGAADAPVLASDSSASSERDAERLRELAFLKAMQAYDATLQATVGRIVLIRATDWSGWGPGHRFKHDYGWSNALGAPVDVMDVAGEHLSIMRQPQVNSVAACIRSVLAETGM